MRKTYILIALVLLGAMLSQSAQVRADPSVPLSVTGQDDGVHIAWQDGAPPSGGTSLTAARSDWQIVHWHDVQVPGKLLALRVADGVAVVPQFNRLTSTPWAGTLTRGAAPVPQNQVGDPHPDLAAQPASNLPNAPVVVLRDARMRGVRIVVLLISPLFERAGVQQAATDVEALVPNATLFDGGAAASLDTTTPFLSAAPQPNNPAALVASAVLRVSSAGMQRVTGASLAASGLNLNDALRLHLYHNGTEIALDVRDNGDNALGADDELRFFAPTPGDRWNATDAYWLTLEATPGLRMTSRSAQPGSAPLRDTAFQSGRWLHNTIYDSTLPGPDGDHWYASDLKTAPSLPSMSTLATLQPTLPLAVGTTTLIVDGSAYTAGQHNLKIGQGTARVFLPQITAPPTSGVANTHAEARATASPAAEASPPLATWSGTGDWSHTFTIASPISIVEVTLVSGKTADGVDFDSIRWQRPVQLTFAGQSALFETEAGNWQYRLSDTAPGRTLYDVTDPQNPVLVALPDGATTSFQDGQAAHRYALTGSPDTLATPQVAAHSPVDLRAPINADAVYIALGDLHPALAPLVALRQSQGYAVRVVDLQAIYDLWSFGQVSPEAIRSFIRYAAATWSRTPRAVTLVGDGTIDPLNYTGISRTDFPNNVNLVPPYVAVVDPWSGETACDTCYALLDSDDVRNDALPDLTIGRLPVKNSAELERLAAKIVKYETQARDSTWHPRNVFIADNYRDADGTTDEAGDFAASSDKTVALQPAGVENVRVYYDPSYTHVGVPWREPDATLARQKTVAALNAGTDLFNYVGHSNQYQLAVTNTDSNQGPGYLLTLYDADALTNSNRLAIMLEMTCLTSAFQTPARSGTTIDERMLLASGGGAAAVWGSTGRGVTSGHDYLQAGFYATLWHDTSPQASLLGTLITAGYQTLFTQGSCCQESIDTFMLLGDPLTRVRVR